MDIGRLTKDVTNSLSNGMFSSLFMNPIYVALLITTIIMLIVVCMYDKRSLVKTSFYIFCTSTAVIFLHNKLLLLDYRKKLSSNDSENIVNSIQSSTPVIGQGAPSVIGGKNDTVDSLGYLNL
jgi:hypothetical protein